VDFGATYGLKSTYFKSRTSNAASAGILRFANNEGASWRNAANSADLALKVNASNVLEFNGNPILTLALGTANYPLKMNAAGTAYEWGLLANANIDASAAIAHSKMAALTASRALVSDGSGVVSVSSVTSTEVGYLSGVTAPTGSGALVLATSPTLVTPTLGVASATSINKVTLTAPATGSTLTIADGKTLTASNTLTFTGTDASSVAFGTGGTVAYTGGTLAQFAATTSAQLAGVISDETGSGALVFATSPTLVTPTLGVASATSVNKVAITAPATSATLTIADGKTLTASNTLTFTGTDTSSVAFGSGGTVAYTGGTLAQFAATTSAELAGVISDETGSGALVFASSPALVSPTITSGATVRGDLLLQNTSGSQPTLQLSEDPDNGTNKITIQAPATLGADYTLTRPTDDGDPSQVLTTNGSGTLSWSTVATDALNQYNVKVGNGSSVATAVDTN
jgi:hypothetical protein